MDFSEYLYSKKIDSDAFRNAKPEQWVDWKHIFEQVHPASFTAQKLFLINPLRRLFPYHQVTPPSGAVERPKKPLIKPKSRPEKEAEQTTAKPKVRPKMAKPKMAPNAEPENKVEENKPKIKPRPKPVIKKRPNTD